MKFVFIASVLLFSLIASVSFSQYASPESVTYDSLGRRYLISNTSSQKIVQRDLNGNVTDFVTVGSAIHGVTVYNGKVYVCNGTKIRGYDLTSAAEVYNVTVTGSSFLNDLAINNSGMIYVSDFTAKRIYKLNSNNSDYWIYVANTVNTPNGLYVDDVRNRLVFCCWGANAPVRSVNFADTTVATIITTPYSNCDGIVLGRYDFVYISSWGSQSVIRYNPDFTAPLVIFSSLSNPADIFINKTADSIAIPNAGNSTVLFERVQYPLGITSNNSALPEDIKLFQNYPNPFNPITNLGFGISIAARSGNLGFVSLKVYDELGKEVATLVNENKTSGYYEVEFDGSSLSSGIYFYQLVSGNFTETRKMILIK